MNTQMNTRVYELYELRRSFDITLNLSNLDFMNFDQECVYSISSSW